MAVTKAFTLYAVDVDDVLIDQVKSMGVSTELNEILEGGDGSHFNKFAAVGEQRDLMSFSTTALKAALDKVPLSGLKITAGAVVTAFFQAFAEGSTRGGTSKHVKMIVNEGIAVPRTLTVDNNGVATLSYDVVCTYDGTNVPILVTKEQSLAGDPTVDQLHTVGPVKINGTTIEGIQSINIDFGISLIILGGDGEGHVTYVAVQKIQPTITFVTLDLEVLESLKLGGTAQGETDSVVFLRKIDQNGLRVADGTAEHISFTITGDADDPHAMIHVQSGDATDEGEATASVRIIPTYDDSNDPIVIATAVAIT